MDALESNFDQTSPPANIIWVTVEELRPIVLRSPDSEDTNSCMVWFCDGFVVKRVKPEMCFVGEQEISAMEHLQQRLQSSITFRRFLEKDRNHELFKKLAVPWKYLLTLDEVPYLICQRIDGSDPEIEEDPILAEEWDTINDALFDESAYGIQNGLQMLPDRTGSWRQARDGSIYFIDFGVPLVSREMHALRQCAWRKHFLLDDD